MKDYSTNIIDYRGGKALLIDSLDIVQMTSRVNNEDITMIEEKSKEVDYVLLITSMPLHTLRPKIRELFNQPHKSQVNCFRHITEKGKQTWNKYLEEQTKELQESLDILKIGNSKEVTE